MIIGDVSAISGNAIWISFILAAVIASFTGLSYAELASMFPKSAAEYIYVKHAFGINFVALFVGCLTIFVAITSAATVAIGFSGYLSVFFPHLSSIVYAVILIMVLSIVNFYGIRESAWTNSIFTLVEISGLAIIIIAGFLIGSGPEINFFELPETAQVLHIAQQFLALLTSTALIFFAYYGFENISNISEETRNPTRVIPKGLTDFNTNNFHNLSSSLYLKHCSGWMERIIFIRSTSCCGSRKGVWIPWHCFAVRYCIICYNKYRSNDACIRIQNYFWDGKR